MSTKYEIIEIDSIEISVDVSLLPKADEMHFNATSIAGQFGKKPSDWLKTDQAKQYMELISRRENIPYENIVRTVQGGKYQGTWLHHKLTLPFARWCSVEFEYNLDKWIDRRISEEHQRRQHSLEARTGFLPLTNAIQAAHPELKPYHFSNECNMLNKIVTGMTAKKFKAARGVDSVRDALSAAQLQLLDKLQRQNATLIELGLGYEERKRMLEQGVVALVAA
ncbi:MULTISPECIES: KilA-N domain-containing protein [Methylomonas]|uniref:KilA-N domain-containing protein n=2 Tax=Methylomonas TaxID=416 RepID=A0A140E4S9_9GAMM|nr:MULTISPECIES: KilA-N domain-containing protein [Methylomonas]AMK75403.1 hypothetical protein JT25_002680 [Methylomonas denitrificans]OAI01191.1 hypothetical protein A1342_19255 [Methylomonas methanica]TCV78097.1 KilA domain-containing protein [Methylomonas methanica]